MFVFRGALKFHIRAFELAIRDLSKAASIDSACPLAYFNRAVCYQEFKDYQKVRIWSNSETSIENQSTAGSVIFAVWTIMQSWFEVKHCQTTSLPASSSTYLYTLLLNALTYVESRTLKHYVVNTNQPLELMTHKVQVTQACN